MGSKMSVARCVAIALVAGLVALATVLVFSHWTLPPVMRWLDVGEEPKSVDYVMVLGGGETTRPFVAAALVRAGLAQRALVGNITPDTDARDGITLSASERNCRILRRRGVADEDVVLLPGNCGNTFDEATALADFLRDDPQAEVIVVTHNFHTRRARWVFRRVLGDRADRVTFVSAPVYELSPKNWWRSDRGVQLVVGEYFKLLFYYLRYGQGIYWLAIGGLVVVVVLVAVRRRSRERATAVTAT